MKWLMSNSGCLAGQQVGDDLPGDCVPAKAAAVVAGADRQPRRESALPIIGRPSAVKPMIPAQQRTIRTVFRRGKSVVRQEAMPERTAAE